MEKHPVEQIAEMGGGTIKEVGEAPDGSGWALVSFPLRRDHWIYQPEDDIGPAEFNVPPMPFRMGTDENAALTIGKSDDLEDAGISGRGLTMTKQAFADQIRRVGRYAVRASTMNGKDMDFDPDAMLQNLVVGFLGYHTDDGLSDDKWANPREVK